MTRHPRSLLTAKARVELSESLLAVAGKYSLTFAETIMILAEFTREWAVDWVREERKADDVL